MRTQQQLSKCPLPFPHIRSNHCPILKCCFPLNPYSVQQLPTALTCTQLIHNLYPSPGLLWQTLPQRQTRAWLRNKMTASMSRRVELTFTGKGPLPEWDRGQVTAGSEQEAVMSVGGRETSG